MATVMDRETPTPMRALTPGEAPRPWHFNFSVIDNTEYLSESFALRYEVYCNEREFLNRDLYPTKLEMDQYDHHAIHLGGINQDGVMIGTVRLVLPSSIGFPLFEHCELFPEYKYLADIKAQQTFAEISRLAISKNYRRRQNDGLYGLAYNNDFENTGSGENRSQSPTSDDVPHRRSKPEIILGLYKSLYQASKRQGVTHWFAAMEKTLLRLLHRFHFEFIPVGPELDYYGPVVPYIATVSEVEEAVFRHSPELFADFMTGLEPELIPAYARNPGIN